MKAALNGRVVFFGRPPDKTLEYYVKQCVEEWVAANLPTQGTAIFNYAARLFFTPSLKEPTSKWVACEIEITDDKRIFSGRVVAANAYRAVAQTLKALRPREPLGDGEPEPTAPLMSEGQNRQSQKTQET